jgi:tryptophanyl-tRNA synthetase
MMRIFSGIQPTGALHLGNDLGAIVAWRELQAIADCTFCIVDLHAITVFQDPEALRQSILLTAATYLACGLDPDRVTIYPQSAVPQHAELAWLLSCHTPMGWLNRMTQFKDKAGKNKDQAVLGLYAYPVLMAADIVLFGATHVPVGEDQKQHLELARDIAAAVNRAYHKDLLVIPEPMVSKVAPRIMSLRDGTKKMSKSDPSDASRIHLTDDDDAIAQKIRRAKTDSDALPSDIEGLAHRPEAKNLLTILSVLENRTLSDTLGTYAGQTFSVLKDDLTSALIAHITPIRQGIQERLADPEALTALLVSHAAVGREKAEATMARIRESFGFLKFS